ncbi:hypothetical protein HK096_005544, partial [Nowakowskiella sp. JEL0078]
MIILEDSAPQPNQNRSDSFSLSTIETSILNKLPRIDKHSSPNIAAILPRNSILSSWNTSKIRVSNNKESVVVIENDKEHSEQILEEIPAKIDFQINNVYIDDTTVIKNIENREFIDGKLKTIEVDLPNVPEQLPKKFNKHQEKKPNLKQNFNAHATKRTTLTSSNLIHADVILNEKTDETDAKILEVNFLQDTTLEMHVSDDEAKSKNNVNSERFETNTTTAGYKSSYLHRSPISLIPSQDKHLDGTEIPTINFENRSEVETISKDIINASNCGMLKSNLLNNTIQLMTDKENQFPKRPLSLDALENQGISVISASDMFFQCPEVSPTSPIHLISDSSIEKHQINDSNDSLSFEQAISSSINATNTSQLEIVMPLSIKRECGTGKVQEVRFPTISFSETRLAEGLDPWVHHARQIEGQIDYLPGLIPLHLESTCCPSPDDNNSIHVKTVKVKKNLSQKREFLASAISYKRKRDVFISDFVRVFPNGDKFIIEQNKSTDSRRSIIQSAKKKVQDQKKDVNFGSRSKSARAPVENKFVWAHKYLSDPFAIIEVSEAKKEKVNKYNEKICENIGPKQTNIKVDNQSGKQLIKTRIASAFKMIPPAKVKLRQSHINKKLQANMNKSEKKGNN